MLQTRSFNLNTQHTVFRVPYTEVADAQLYPSCILPASRAVKQCIENELTYLTIQADATKYKEVFSMVSRQVICGKLFYLLL